MAKRTKVQVHSQQNSQNTSSCQKWEELVIYPAQRQCFGVKAEGRGCQQSDTQVCLGCIKRLSQALQAKYNCKPVSLQKLTIEFIRQLFFVWQGDSFN